MGESENRAGPDHSVLMQCGQSCPCRPSHDREASLSCSLSRLPFLLLRWMVQSLCFHPISPAPFILGSLTLFMHYYPSASVYLTSPQPCPSFLPIPAVRVCLQQSLAFPSPGNLIRFRFSYLQLQSSVLWGLTRAWGRDYGFLYGQNQKAMNLLISQAFNFLSNLLFRM